MKRRRFLAASSLAAIAPACSKKESAGPGATLNVYTWPDYVGSELVARFEKENGCRVVIDTYDSNETMHAKIQGGARGYDLIYPSSYMIEVMKREKLLQKLDGARLPNARHLDPAILAAASGDLEYSVPYMTTYTCLGYSKSKVPSPEPSWKMLERADLKGRTTLFDDMRETIGAALRFLGHGINTVSEPELNAAKEVILRWKANIAKFANEDWKTGLASGEFLLVHGYSGDLFQIVMDNPDVALLLPQEGMVRSVDEMVIPVGAKNVTLAHKYINFLLDPKVAAENMEATGYVCPNKDAMPLLSEGMKKHPVLNIPPDLLAKCETTRDLGENLAKYTKIWDEVKAGS